MTLGGFSMALLRSLVLYYDRWLFNGFIAIACALLRSVAFSMACTLSMFDFRFSMACTLSIFACALLLCNRWLGCGVALCSSMQASVPVVEAMGSFSAPRWLLFALLISFVVLVLCLLSTAGCVFSDAWCFAGYRREAGIDRKLVLYRQRVVLYR